MMISPIKVQWQLLIPQQLQAKLATKSLLLIDIRELTEYQEGHLAGSILKPLSQFNPNEFKNFEDFVIYCRSGKRSHSLAEKLIALGCHNFMELEGGILAWQKANLPIEI